MRQLTAAIFACAVLMPSSVLWAADTQANQERTSTNQEKSSVTQEPVAIGASAHEEMAGDAMSEPMPPKEVAHMDAMQRQPESAGAESTMDKDKTDDLMDQEKTEDRNTMDQDKGVRKHHGPKDMVMMNMMMHKMKQMKGPNVVATYDGGIVVINGNKITKYDDELNYVNELDLKKNK